WLKSGRADGLAYEDFLEFRDRSGIFSGLAAHGGVPLNLQSASSGDMVWGEVVTENYFSVLGMRPVLGQFFDGKDAAAGSDPFVVLSYDSWTHRFNTDPHIVGSTLRLNGTVF